MPSAHYLRIAETLRARRVQLKINTVVNALNCDEDMGDLLLAMRPARWKLLQVLPVAGQNDQKVEPLLIDDLAFRRYRVRHQRVADAGVQLVAEENEDMTGSYAMVDPAGRFFLTVTLFGGSEDECGSLPGRKRPGDCATRTHGSDVG